MVIIPPPIIPDAKIRLFALSLPVMIRMAQTTQARIRTATPDTVVVWEVEVVLLSSRIELPTMNRIADSKITIIRSHLVQGL